MIDELFAQENTEKIQAQQQGQVLEERRLQAINILMETPTGRHFLRWILTECRAFDAVYQSDPYALYFAEGKRHLGMHILNLLEKAATKHLVTLTMTKGEDNV